MMRKIGLYIFTVILLLACSDHSLVSDDGKNPEVEIQVLSSFSPQKQTDLLNKIAYDYFSYYWNECHSISKMARIGTERPANTIALAGSAYAITALPVAVENKWISYNEAIERLLTVCRFLNKAERYHGAWSHWMDGKTGAGLPFNPKQQSTGDLVETSFMMMALLVCSEYFNQSSPEEVEIRNLIEGFWNTIEWNFYTNNENVLYWAWDKNMGFAPLKVVGPNEALPTYILALAAPTNNAISKTVYEKGWKGGIGYYNANRHSYGYKFELGRDADGGPLFTTQHPFLWFNPFQLADEKTDYWEHCTNHALINRHYCINKAPKVYGYNTVNWGLSACYGPQGKDYKGRSPSRDDGVIASTASIGTISLTPFYALEAVDNMLEIAELNGKHGIVDAYSKVDNWNDTRYLSISIMPIVGIIENYKTGLIWKLAMQNKYIQEGLKRAGFVSPEYSTGFCQMPINSEDNTVDLTSNPITGNYSLRYSLDKDYIEANVVLVNKDLDSEQSIKCQEIKKGIHSLSINYYMIKHLAYDAQLYVDKKLVSTQKIRLR